MSRSITIQAVAYIPERPALVHAGRKRILVRDYLRYCNNLVERVSDIMHYLLERGYITAYKVGPPDVSILFSCSVPYLGGKPAFIYDKIMFEVYAEVPIETKTLEDYKRLEELLSEIKEATEHAIRLAGWIPERVWVY